MIIDCISDLHGSYPPMPGGDLLIVAGDLTARDKLGDYKTFFNWLCDQPYRKIVYIAGNHDGYIQKYSPPFPEKYNQSSSRHLEYLQDSGTEFEGLKIWGSPWTPWFCDWHFMLPRGKELRAKWALIPDDTDILITHGPPKGILDKVRDSVLCYHEDCPDGHVGCHDLRERVTELKCKLHVFGHVHEGYGQEEHHGRRFVNCAHMNRAYKPVNKPIRIIL